MVIEDDQFDDSFFVDASEGMNVWSPDDLVNFSGADTAAAAVNHPIPGRDRARNAPPYSYTSAISSARTGSAFPNNASVAGPLGFQQQYYDLTHTAAVDDGWTTTTSASGSGSINSSDNSSGFPFGSNTFGANPQLIRQQYAQVEGRTSYLAAAPQSFAQAEPNLPANQIWGSDIGLDPVGNAGGMASFNFSPASQPGSFFEGPPESPDMSGGSEVNFNGTAGIANYASTSISSAPESPISTRDHHDSKRPKKSATFAHARDGSISTSASSSGRGGTKGKQKRELRSASRTSKNKQERVAETSEEQKSRNSHNLVEKQYRNRLNAQFEDLLHTLPESSGGATLGGDGDDGRANNKGEKKRISKAEVLDMARQRILFLEEENRKIERENEDLRKRSLG